MTNQPVRHRQRGDYLVELMLVIALVGILAVAALNAYRPTLVRAKFAESLGLMRGAGTDMAFLHAYLGRWPGEEELAAVSGYKTAGKYTYIKIHAGAISASLRPQALPARQPSRLSLRAAFKSEASPATVAWVCGYAAAPPGFTVMGENETQMDKVYLPYVCR